MLMCFIFAKSAQKLLCFSDDQMKSWHALKLRRFRPKIKTKTSILNDTVSGQILKSKNKLRPQRTLPNPNPTNPNSLAHTKPS